MASIKTKFSVGIFVLLGVFVAFIAIIWLGMSHFFEQGQLYSAYFDDSVQGLAKDSPVKYRGVTIGRVADILVAPDAKLIEIILKIESDMKPDKNIVAQLKSVGITGIMFIELDMKRKGEPDLSPSLSFPPRHTVIDTKPSEIRNLIDNINDVVKQLQNMDLEGMSVKFKKTLDRIIIAVDEAKIGNLSSDIRTSLDKWDAVMDSINIRASLDKWDAAMDSIENAGSTFKSFSLNTDKAISNLNGTISKVDKIVEDNQDDIAQTIQDFNRTVNNAEKMIQKGIFFVEKTDYNLSSLQKQVLATMQSIEKTSETLNRSIELISDQPSMLLYGSPLPEKATDKD
ncbi:MAG: MCE family protein [Proteobacteria bacterium]|nr:MCE family protein [Pseudomonadota bacterium]MBU1711798.1 MCE family protein [Pseudomonadota bacterium]